MPDAVLYARVSSRRQREHGRSLETQLDRCRDYADARGYQITATYSDVHTGADFLGRPQLGVMRTAIRAGMIDVVVVLAVDRLSRDLVHLHFLLVEAEAMGARFEFVLEHLDQTPEGQLIRAIQGFAAEIERLSLRERGRQSVRARIRRGRWLGVTPPFGYHWHRHHSGQLEIEEATAAVVRWIFADVVHGFSPHEVAAALNANGIPTAQACPTGWSAKAVRRIVRNPIYRGATDVEDTSEDHPTSNNQVPLEDWVQPQRYSPAPIVTPVQWQAANDRLLARARQRSVFPEPLFPDAYLLGGGLATCGRCGRPLLGRGVRVDVLFYRCAGTSRRIADPCPGLRLAAPGLDDRVWRRVLRTAASGRVWPASTKNAGRFVILPETKSVDEAVRSDADLLPIPADDAVKAAWRHLVHQMAEDVTGLQRATIKERRAWLRRLGIQVCAWPRGSGRGVVVTTRLDPADDDIPGARQVSNRLAAEPRRARR